MSAKGLRPHRRVSRSAHGVDGPGADPADQAEVDYEFAGVAEEVAVGFAGTVDAAVGVGHLAVGTVCGVGG